VAKYKVGDKVKIEKGGGDWDEMCDEYIGREATIVKIDHHSSGYSGYSDTYTIDIDQGDLWWSEDDMEAITSNANALTQGPPPRCKKCGDLFEYADPDPEFVCYVCRN